MKFLLKKVKPALSVLTDCIDFHTFAVGHSSVGESSPAEGCEECLTKIERVMAKPIEETPILRGKDAERFLKRIEENHKVTQEEYDKIMSTYERWEKIIEW